MRAGESRLVAFRAASRQVRRPPRRRRGPRTTRRRSSARPRNSGSASSRRVASRTARRDSSRRGTDSPVPDHATRAAFSPMSPTEGQTSSGFPAASALRHRPMPAVADHHVRRRHRLRVEHPIDQRRVVGHLDRPLGPVPIRRRQHPHRLIRQPVERNPQQLALRDPATCSARPAPAAPRPPESPSVRPAPRRRAARSPARAPATPRGYSSCGNVPTIASSSLIPP